MVKIIKLKTNADRGTRRLVQYNESGRRCGETHHLAKLSDAEVEQIRDLHEFAGHSYTQIAKAFGCCKATVALICQYRRRADTARWGVLKSAI